MVKCESLRMNMYRITHTGKSMNFLVTSVSTLFTKLLLSYCQIYGVGEVTSRTLAKRLIALANVTLAKSLVGEIDCNNDSRYTTGISYHCFPRDEALRSQCLAKISRADLVFSKNSRLFSEHFTPECYVRDLKAEILCLKPRSTLKPGAIPTFFLGCCKLLELLITYA